MATLKEAKGGSWYDDNWQPYCLMCNTVARMQKRDYGFECHQCGNMTGWDLIRLQESPLNDPEYVERMVRQNKMYPLETKNHFNSLFE